MKKILASLMVFGTMTTSLFADEPQEAIRAQNSFWQTLIMIGIAIVFFYFILWRPERKRRKEMEEKRSQMKKGDQVVAMGIVGTVERIKSETVILKMVDGSQVEFLKGAISEVKNRSDKPESSDQE